MRGIVFWGGHMECLYCPRDRDATDYDCKMWILNKKCPVLKRKEERRDFHGRNTS